VREDPHDSSSGIHTPEPEREPEHEHESGLDANKKVKAKAQATIEPQQRKPLRAYSQQDLLEIERLRGEVEQLMERLDGRQHRR
jgi:hypothetical protein